MATQVLEHPTAAKGKKPQAGTVQWFNECVERGRREPFAEVVMMTPAMAHLILGNNPDNRSVRPVKIRHFARDMAGGRWPLNGETIIIAKSGELNDGQHRLLAIIDANVCVPVTIHFGVARSTRTTVDQGSARGAGAYLRMDGVPYAETLAAVARAILGYEESGGRNTYLGNGFTPAEIVDRAERDPGIMEAVNATAPLVHDAKPLKTPHSVLAFVYYICAREEENDALDFMEKVARGENIRGGHPAFTLRTKLLNNKYTRDEKIELMLRAWNFYRRDKSVSPSSLSLLGNLPAII